MSNKLFPLFISFFKIGSFSFGGGYAMLPLIKEEIVKKRQWLNEETLYELFTLAEVTPGPVAINIATFVGAQIQGFWGSLTATLAVIFPSFIVIYFLTFLLETYAHLPFIHWAFFGIRSSILILIAYSSYRLFTQSHKDSFFYILLVINAILLWIIKMNIFFILFLSALAGIGYELLERRQKYE